MKLIFRKAQKEDLDFLMKLEHDSFPEYQQNSKQNLKRGIKSSFQEIIIVEGVKNNKKPTPIGAAVLFKHKHMLRIYSIAIISEYRKAGIGNELISHIKNFALKNKNTGITLEARSNDEKLVHWYQSKGFNILKTVENYYSNGESAVKMGIRIGQNKFEENKNIVVIDKPYKWDQDEIGATVISVKEYINDKVYQNNPNFRVFNLCSSYKYQRYGYYISLLASARGQRVIPTVTTIRDFSIANVIQSLAFDLSDLINSILQNEKSQAFSLDIFFGQTPLKAYKTIASKLFQLFEAPIFTVYFIKDDKWIIKNIKVLTFNNLDSDQKESFHLFAQKHFTKKRYNLPKLAHYRYDIAVLINPFEENPPSNKEALDKFRTAANKKGVYVELITKHDKDKINEFDALFIRETTNVNHYTYELSRLAFAEGLVVVDDPWSILKCSNKIYQDELFKTNKIRTPKTIVITKNMFKDKVLKNLNYPIILKQPDSAFSLGVIKVNNEEEAKEELTRLFKITDMVISQEFLYSEFDWRIGILDNKPLFACKYFMSKNHWQIYNWQNDEEDKSGNHETISIDKVPADIIRTALKAASLIGDGLYGVDLKFVNNKVYVIEVNDNPNIDFGVEDSILKDELYNILIDSFVDRIEIMKNVRQINLIDNKHRNPGQRS